MENIVTDSLSKIHDACGIVNNFAGKIRDCMPSTLLPPSAFDETATPDIYLEEKLLRQFGERLPVFKDAGHDIFCDVYSIVEDAKEEIKRNALKHLGKQRKAAYASQCKKGLSLLKEGKYTVELAWSLARYAWQYADSGINAEGPNLKIPFTDLSIAFGSKVASIAQLVELEVEDRIRDLEGCCTSLEDVINDNLLSDYNIDKQSSPPSVTSEKTIFKFLPPKVMLLEQLGFFNLPEVQKLNWESKGKLVSALCGGSADNAVDYIKYCDPNPKKLVYEKNPYKNRDNVVAVKKLLQSLSRD